MATEAPSARKSPGQKEKHLTVGGEKNRCHWVPAASPFPQPAPSLCGQQEDMEQGHAAMQGVLASSQAGLCPRKEGRSCFSRPSCARAQCCWGRAHPAALQLSRRTKPLWGLEGLSHTARRAGAPCQSRFRGGVGLGAVVPLKETIPQKCSQREMSLGLLGPDKGSVT